VFAPYLVLVVCLSFVVAQTTFESGEFFSFTSNVSVMDGQNKMHVEMVVINSCKFLQCAITKKLLEKKINKCRIVLSR
jgi:hypothetical protein